jgi:hypothetical protein
MSGKSTLCKSDSLSRELFLLAKLGITTAFKAITAPSSPPVPVINVPLDDPPLSNSSENKGYVVKPTAKLAVDMSLQADMNNQGYWKVASSKRAFLLVVDAMTAPDCPATDESFERFEKFKRLCFMIDEDHCPTCGGCHLTTEQIELLGLPKAIRRRCHGTYSWSANKIFASINTLFWPADVSQTQKAYFINTVLKADKVDMATTDDHN